MKQPDFEDAVSSLVDMIEMEVLDTIDFYRESNNLNLSEQQQIVEYLDEKTQLIERTISIEEKRTKLLKEYKQSLIFEVVTGKKRVVG